MTAHLMEQGFEHIALVNSHKSVTTYQEREQGYREALHDAGRAVEESLMMRDGPKMEDGRAMTLSLLQRTPRPDAIFAASCSLGLGALAALREMNLTVLQDIGFAVFDDIEHFAIFSPTITAVRQPAYELGQKAAALLLDSLREQKFLPQIPTILPVQLMVRESSLKRRR